MKRSNLSKVVGAGVLTLSTAIMPSTLPASAQVVAPGIEREVIYETEDIVAISLPQYHYVLPLPAAHSG